MQYGLILCEEEETTKLTKILGGGSGNGEGTAAATVDGAWPASGARATCSKRREKRGGAGFSPCEEALGEGMGGGDGAAEEIQAAA
jgi:hypothetical protein